MKRSTISSNARSLIGIAVMAVLSLAVIAVSDPLYKALRGPVTTARPEAPLADGIYTHEALEPDANGFRDRTTLTVSDGIIVSVSGIPLTGTEKANRSFPWKANIS